MVGCIKHEQINGLVGLDSYPNLVK